MEIFCAVICACFILLWLRIRGIEAQAERDARYFEWWMRSMENRKEDREWFEPADKSEDTNGN